MKLSEIEIGFLKSLNPKWKWITKENTRHQYNYKYAFRFYEYKPSWGNNRWNSCGDQMLIMEGMLNDDLFKSFKYDELYNIEELLNNVKH